VGQTVEAVAASTGAPYIARITGRDQTYGWKREFLKCQWKYPSAAANPAAIVRLILPVTAVGPLPAALEVRWGPATGPSAINQKTGAQYRRCGFRALFILDSAGLREASEQHVSWLIDEGLGAVGPAKRPPDSRARIRFDEEV
jgi:hypothetical protein